MRARTSPARLRPDSSPSETESCASETSARPGARRTTAAGRLRSRRTGEPGRRRTLLRRQTSCGRREEEEEREDAHQEADQLIEPPVRGGDKNACQEFHVGRIHTPECSNVQVPSSARALTLCQEAEVPTMEEIARSVDLVSCRNPLLEAYLRAFSNPQAWTRRQAPEFPQRCGRPRTAQSRACAPKP